METGTVKFYNYQNAKENAKEESMLKRLISAQFKIPEATIQVSYQKNVKIKKTVEIWIDTKEADIKQQQMIKEQN